MVLSREQVRALRGRAQQLAPVVRIAGRGITENVLAELDAALNHHELIKIRVQGTEREARRAVIAELCARTGAELVQSIGHVACLFRRNPEAPRIPFPT